MASLDAGVIQQILAPATMVPACGLLLLSSTARMNTVLARIRAFHKERLEAWAMDAAAGTKGEALRELRLDGLEHQTERLLRRAGLLRATMLLLFVSIAFHLVSVVALGAGLVASEVPALWSDGALGLFVIGLLLMLASMLTSFFEVFWITETVRYEHERVAALCERHAPAEAGLDTDAGEGTAL